MTYRSLGTTGLQVFPITFGGNVFGWTLDETASFGILDALADRGMNFIDTADAYSRWVPGNQGENRKPSSATGSSVPAGATA